MSKTYFLFPKVEVDITQKRVYPRERLPYPGDGGPLHCQQCLEEVFNWVGETDHKPNLGSGV